MGIERALDELIEQTNPEGGLERVLGELDRQGIVAWLKSRRGDRAYQAAERMRKNFYHLWRVLDELYLSPNSDPAKLEVWRQAPRGSQEWRKARQHDEAIEVLITAVSD